MQHGNISQSVFTLLHGGIVALSSYERLSDTHVSVLNTKVPYHAKDRRPLFIFDGEIPQDGMAIATKQTHREDLQKIEIDPYHRRKEKEFQKTLSTPEMIYRRFLIVPQGAGVGIRFRKKTYAFRYVFFRFQHVENDVWKFVVNHSTF